MSGSAPRSDLHSFPTRRSSDLAWQAVAAGTASTGGLGTYVLGADGQWTYTLDNSNATVQGLNVGQSTTDTLAAHTSELTAQPKTVTILVPNNTKMITGSSSADQ